MPLLWKAKKSWLWSAILKISSFCPGPNLDSNIKWNYVLSEDIRQEMVRHKNGFLWIWLVFMGAPYSRQNRKEVNTMTWCHQICCRGSNAQSSSVCRRWTKLGTLTTKSLADLQAGVENCQGCLTLKRPGFGNPPQFRTVVGSLLC